MIQNLRPKYDIEKLLEVMRAFGELILFSQPKGSDFVIINNDLSLDFFQFYNFILFSSRFSLNIIRK